MFIYRYFLANYRYSPDDFCLNKKKLEYPPRCGSPGPLWSQRQLNLLCLHFTIHVSQLLRLLLLYLLLLRLLLRWIVLGTGQPCCCEKNSFLSNMEAPPNYIIAIDKSAFLLLLLLEELCFFANTGKLLFPLWSHAPVGGEHCNAFMDIVSVSEIEGNVFESISWILRYVSYFFSNWDFS